MAYQGAVIIYIRDILQDGASGCVDNDDSGLGGQDVYICYHLQERQMEGDKIIEALQIKLYDITYNMMVIFLDAS